MAPVQRPPIRQEQRQQRRTKDLRRTPRRGLSPRDGVPPSSLRAPSKWERRRSLLPMVLSVLLIAALGGGAAGTSQRRRLTMAPAPVSQPASKAPALTMIPVPHQGPDLWQGGPAPGELVSSAAFLMRVEDGAAVYTKEPNRTVYPASLTKMMTVLVALEQLEDLDQVVQLPPELYPPLQQQSAALSGLLPGERVGLRHLLYGAILPSGAESCEMLAMQVAGSSQAFVELMNQKAQELGMSYTHFTNTTGLHDDMQYTSVRDMAQLLRYALGREDFRQVFTTFSHTIPPTNLHDQGLTLRSNLSNSLGGVYTFDGGVFLGGKTGYTPEAGLCLASLARVQEEEFILVTVGAPGSSRSGSGYLRDARLLYQQLGKSLGVTPLPPVQQRS